MIMTDTGIPAKVLAELEGQRDLMEQADITAELADQSYRAARDALHEAMIAVGQCEEIWGQMDRQAQREHDRLVTLCQAAGVVRTATGFRPAAAGESEDQVVCACPKRWGPLAPGQTVVCGDCGEVFVGVAGR
jgi:hypothetical protein